QIRLFLFRKGEPHVRTALYRTDLCLYPVVKLYGIIMWFSNFIIMVKRQSPFIFIDDKVSLSGHQGKNRIITHPRTTLVYLLKTTDRIRLIGIFPTITILSCLCRKKMHRKRQAHRRVSISIGQRPFGIRPLQSIHILYQVLLLCITKRYLKRKKNNPNYFFYFHPFIFFSSLLKHVPLYIHIASKADQIDLLLNPKSVRFSPHLASR